MRSGKISVLFLFLIVFSVQAQNKNLDNRCQTVELPDHKTFKVDAREMNQKYNSRFKSQDRVQIILKNMNPFLFEYKVTINAVPVPEPALEYFFSILPGLEEIVSVEAAENRVLIKKEDLDDYNKAMEEAIELYEKIRSEINNANKLLKDHQHILQSERASCADLVDTAQNLKKEMEEGIKKIEKMADDFKCAICSIEKKVEPYKDSIDVSFKDKINELNRGYKLVEENIKDYKKRLNSLKKTLGRLENFTKSYTIGPYGAPTDVKVEIERKNLKIKGAKFESLMTAKLNFGGGPRFALAAGVGFSFLDKRTYIKAWGFELDRSGNPVVPRNDTAVVSKGEDSNSRSFILLMLHTRVFDLFEQGTFHISLGITGKTEDDKVVEYIGGVSLGLAEERLFMTLGLHYGKLQELDKQVYIGAPVPEDVNDIPVTNKWECALAFSLTYKIK